MKHIQTFESFLFEDKAERLTINAALWAGRTPEIINDGHGPQYIYFSGEVFGGKYMNFLGLPSNALIVIESYKGEDKLYIKVGCGSEDEKGIKQYRRSIGDSIEVSIEELTADPSGYAKKIADLFISAKRFFDMNFEPMNKRAIFKMEKDLEKPALELINYTIKNYKPA
jgi:hypothetical protein